MNFLSSNSRIGLFALLMMYVTVSCSSMQAAFSEQAYQQAVNLKVESLNMMDKATQLYELHEEEVQALKIELQKAYEYAKSRPNNSESMRQWEIMIDPEGSLLGGFISMWKERGQISTTMVEQSKGNIEEGFDIIMELESGKRKP